VFPAAAGRVHPRFRTPHVALVASGLVSTAGIAGSHLAGDFFLGVDILVTSMLVNFLLISLSVLALPRRNPALAARITVLRGSRLRPALMAAGSALLAVFLAVHLIKDLRAPVDAWYFRSTWLWLGVMVVASLVYAREVRRLRRRGVDLERLFSELPPG
ncbi:MAG: amino acid transporter, partial [Thermoanaerobaculia bacterium]|nr:amino acid transporter [Thermoanaerobaculia bacterium]